MPTQEYFSPLETQKLAKFIVCKAGVTDNYQPDCLINFTWLSVHQFKASEGFCRFTRTVLLRVRARLRVDLQ